MANPTSHSLAGQRMCVGHDELLSQLSLKTLVTY